VSAASEPIWRHWREPYLLIHLLFAGFYLLDHQGIGGTSDGMSLLAQAFFFSVETMATIGYGAVYPESVWVHVVMTAEALVGLLLVALITGLAFARFSRTTHSIRFSQRPWVRREAAGSVLELEVANERRNTVLAVSVQAFWLDGEGQCKLLPFALPDGLPLEDRFVLRHPIDPASALGPAARSAELLVTFSGVDATLERPIHAVQRYGVDQIDWG
jgi:inward rectifier potassium channel